MSTENSRDKRTELHHQYFLHFCLFDKDCGGVVKVYREPDGVNGCIAERS